MSHDHELELDADLIDAEIQDGTTDVIRVVLRITTAAQADQLVKAASKIRTRLRKAEAAAAAEAAAQDGVATPDATGTAAPAAPEWERELLAPGPSHTDPRDVLTPVEAASLTEALDGEVPAPGPDAPPAARAGSADDLLAELAAASPYTIEVDGNDITGRQNLTAYHGPRGYACPDCGVIDSHRPAHMTECHRYYPAKLWADTHVTVARETLAELERMHADGSMFKDEVKPYELIGRLMHSLGAVLGQIDEAAGVTP